MSRVKLLNLSVSGDFSEGYLVQKLGGLNVFTYISI